MIAVTTSIRYLTIANRFLASFEAFLTLSGEKLKSSTSLARAGFAVDATSDPFHTLVPVEFEDGLGPPTALSWLRRRGPPLPESVLHRLFRKRQVKVVTAAGSEGPKRVSKDALLLRGAQLLIPTSAAAPAAPPGSTPTVSRRQEQALAECGELLRRRVLHCDAELLVVNKPAGLPVQGGPGTNVSMDKAMAKALRFGYPEPPRLVHRLDRETSGALVVARTAAAAAWLSAAFSSKSAAVAGGPVAVSRSARSRATAGSGSAAAGSSWAPQVQRVYWAVVEAGDGSRLQREGIIEEPLEIRRSNGRIELQPAVTRYRCLARSGGFAWLELRPATGRKHQLRLHCARHLGAPIVGDDRHGTVRSEAQRGLAALLGLEARAAARGCLQLHARSISISRGGSEDSAGNAMRGPTTAGVRITVTAPMPHHMTAVLVALGCFSIAESQGAT